MTTLHTMKIDENFKPMLQAAQAKLGADSGADTIRKALQSVNDKQLIFVCSRHNFGTALGSKAHEHWLQHQAEKANTAADLETAR